MEPGGLVFVCANQLFLWQVFSGCMEVYWSMATTFHILVGNEIVVDRLLLLSSWERLRPPII